MPFWQNLELLPSATREKSREAPKRSREEYKKSREKFQEGLRESNERMKNTEITAEVMLYIELNEEELKQKMIQERPEDVIQAIGSYDAKQWGQLKQTFAEAQFDLQVEATDEGHPSISMQIDFPEGNVSEKIPLNESLQEALIAKASGTQGKTI
jgi:hypothetical protein